MELLYLWIEDYKNIYRQGFNFSPLYEFEFTPTKEENGKVIEGTLKDNITEKETKEKFYKDFFGEGISNVTAIVGENGAGKSSIMEMNYTFCVYLVENDLYYFCVNKTQEFLVKTNIEHREIESHKETNLFIYYSNSFGFCKINSSIRNLSLTHLLKNNFLVVNYNDSLAKFQTFDSILQCEFVSIFNEYKLPFKLPSSVSISVYITKEIAQLNSYIRQVETDLKFEERYADSHKEEFDIALFFYDKCRKEIIELLDTTNKKEENELMITILKWTVFLNFFNCDLPSGGSRFEMIESVSMYSESINKWFYNFFDNQIKGYYYEKHFVGLSEWEEVYQGWADNTTLLVSFIEDMVNEKKVIVYNKVLYDDNSFFDNGLEDYEFSKWANEPYIDISISLQTDDILDMKNLAFFIEKYKNLIWYNKIYSEGFFDFTWWNMSAGEVSFLSLFSRLHSINFSIDSIREKPSSLEMNREIDSLIILLDEPEIGWHPQWQKSLLNNLLKTLPKIFPNKQIQLILTSHSPFLVSDLPKENVIFLEKEESTGLCKVSKLDSMKETFGANIHTLLTDSFFMKGGLVGEFAQSKIDEVMRLLDKSKLEKEEIEHCEMIISMIGEPIVKTMLRKLLDSKRLRKVDEHEEKLKGYEDRIQKLESEIKKLNKK